MKIEILPNYFLNENGTFNKDEAIKLSGKIAGVCYSKNGLSQLLNESEEKTMRRVDMTLNNGHHSVYDHIMISFNIKDIPKMLAMVINNEKQYTTSEKSARYTQIEKNENSPISDIEIDLYNKWVQIYFDLIKEKYGNVFPDNKIKKLAMENARYLVTVFVPMEMVYTTSLRQINYIASFMKDYIENANNDFERKLSSYMQEFIDELDRLNVLEEGLMRNEKKRKLSLFGHNLTAKKDYFGDIYETTYKGSFAQYAQAHRHRTLNYSLEMEEDKNFYVPEILLNTDLTGSWLSDMNKVREFNPQGEIVVINENGTYEDFILKCKERLCTYAQLEIMEQTRNTLLRYYDALRDSNNPLKDDITKYTKGARCTFPDFTCTENCGFKEGKKLIRKI